MEWRGVLDERMSWPATGRESLIRAAISDWRESLAGLTAAGESSSLRPGRDGAIRIARPASGDVLARLSAGGSYTFRPQQPAAGSDGDFLYADADPADLATALRALRRRAEQAYLDTGQSVLHLAFGTLAWAGRDGIRHVSPLLLLPARLADNGPRQPPVLTAAGGGPVLNPGLTLQLARYGVRLPRLPDPAGAGPPGTELAGTELRGLLDEIRAATAGHSDWLVTDSLLLACLPVSSDAIYRDLLDHEHLIAAHPVVAALAAAAAADPAPAAVGSATGERGEPAGGVTARATAALPPLLLAADTAQRTCVAAALGGRSFLLDGPPGTGKSQTVANMIGALLQAGRTVLFVSEKATALDVVADRLGAAGLADCLLQLHSEHAAPAAVAGSLGRALVAAPATARGPTAEQLSEYSRAVHRVREPLGISLNDVLGLLARTQDLPAAPTGDRPPAALTAASLAEIRHAATALAAAWRPAVEGTSFHWRGITRPGRLDVLLYQAASALEVLGGMVRANGTLAEVTGLTRPSDADSLLALLGHLWGWPEGLPDEWLTVDTLDAVDAAVAQLAALLTAITARESQAGQAAGVPAAELPGDIELPAAEIRALAALTPAAADLANLTHDQISGLAEAFAADAGMLERRLGTLSGLAGMLGLRPPATFGDAADLLTLARLAQERDRPERGWLSRSGYQAASQAARACYDAQHVLARAEAAASAYFTPEALHHDLPGLAQRFGDGHHGLGKLSAEYRADRAALASFTREGVAKETAQQHLGLAAAWQQALTSLATAEAAHAALLGPYYGDRATDFDRLGRALAHAATAVRCSQGQDLSQAAEHISRDAVPKPVITATAAETLADLSEWHGTLAPPPAVTARPELMTGPISDAIGWLQAHLGPLRAAAEFTRVLSETVGRQLTFSQARQLMTLRDAADTARAELTARDSVLRELCGSLYTGTSTDLTALRAALEWARQLRMMITGGPGPLTVAHLRAAESAVPAAQLAEVAAAWREACATLLEAFSPERARELAAELDDYTRGGQVLEAMFNDADGPAEWQAHQAARAALAALGLAPAVDFCAARQVEAAQVARVIERAVLRDWAEYQVQTDPALAVLRDAGPAALLSEYQRLADAQSAAAAASIISAWDARRPAAGTAETAVIEREAERRAGHLPVREVIGRSRNAAQALKPCFLATPLAVSQHLPADLHFDVVIFDEASQIGPASAINCIYRASAVVMAGDRQQLPPAGPGPGGSILDLAQACGAYPTLSLPWHYRSRHEALIGFANGAFYGGRLVVAGGPGTKAGDAGVQLLRGRGGRKHAAGDNPQEAARAAQRVIHHFDTHPDLSLGVVTFSEAQAEAVEAAVSRARQDRSDLDGFFTSDRLRGFFVKEAAKVQGDERDVVIISTGYAPDEDGLVTAVPDALAEDDGWRLLNVASTRARYRTEVVTSIRPGDIPDSAASDGLRQLRSYLSYAARNGLPGPGQA